MNAEGRGKEAEGRGENSGDQGVKEGKFLTTTGLGGESSRPHPAEAGMGHSAASKTGGMKRRNG